MKNNKKRAKIREFDRLEREDSDELDIDMDFIEDVNSIIEGEFEDEDQEPDELNIFGDLDDDNEDDFDSFIEGLDE